MTKAKNMLNDHIKKVEEVKQVLFNQYESIEVEDQEITINISFINDLLKDCERFSNDMQLFLLVEQSGSIDKFNNIFDMIILKDKMYQDFKEVKLKDNSKDSQKSYEYTCDFIVDEYYSTLNNKQTEIFESLIFNEL